MLLAATRHHRNPTLSISESTIHITVNPLPSHQNRTDREDSSNLRWLEWKLTGLVLTSGDSTSLVLPCKKGGVGAGSSAGTGRRMVLKEAAFPRPWFSRYRQSFHFTLTSNKARNQEIWWIHFYLSFSGTRVWSICVVFNCILQCLGKASQTVNKA